MNAPTQGCRRSWAAGFLLTLLFATLGTGVAQAPFDGPLRFGLILPPLPEEGTEVEVTGWDVPARAARQGATMALDEFAYNAELLGIELDVPVVHAADADEARREAERLLTEEDAFAIVGGFGTEHARALAEVAAEHGVPFLNIGSSADVLRHEQCRRTSFHVIPSDAMYLDAIVGFFVRSEFRRWSFVTADTERGQALEERARWSMENRHFGARVAGSVTVPDEDPDWNRIVEELAGQDPGVVLMLLDPAQQLALLEAAEGSGLEAELTGFPYLPAQSRDYYTTVQERAPATSRFWTTAWEATLDSYGAREFNARYRDRFGEPMTASAWLAIVSVKLLYEAARDAQSTEGEAVIERLANPDAAFDIWKGIGVSFRPWDHQLRQSLYLVQIDPETESLFDMVFLVGELPALYLPRTDPLERLDQLGDLASRSRCNF